MKNEKLTFEEVAKILLAKDMRTIKSYVERGLIPAVKINNDEYIESVDLIEKLGIKNFDEPFMSAREAEKFLSFKYNLTCHTCEMKRIPFYRLKNLEKAMLFFRKSELEIWKNREGELSFEYDTSLLDDIHRHHILKMSWKLTNITILNNLDAQENMVASLFLKGVSVEKIAEKLGVSKITLKKTLSKIERRLIRVSIYYSKIIDLFEKNDLFRRYSEEELPSFIEGISRREKEVLEKEKDLFDREKDLRLYLEVIKKHSGEEFVSTDQVVGKYDSFLEKNVLDDVFDHDVRNINCLRFEIGDLTVREFLLNFSRKDILKFRNYGPKSSRSFEKVLADNGYPLKKETSYSKKELREIEIKKILKL